MYLAGVKHYIDCLAGSSIPTLRSGGREARGTREAITHLREGVSNGRALVSGATAGGAVVVVAAALVCKKRDRWETAQAGQYFVITHQKPPRLEGRGDRSGGL